MVRLSATLLVLSLALAACNSSTGDDAERSVPPLEDSAFGDMTSTIDRARGVEDLTLERKRELDEALQADEH